MKIRESVVSLSLIFPHPPEDEKKKKVLTGFAFQLYYLVLVFSCHTPGSIGIMLGWRLACLGTKNHRERSRRKQEDSPGLKTEKISTQTCAYVSRPQHRLQHRTRTLYKKTNVPKKTSRGLQETAKKIQRCYTEDIK